MNIGCISVSLPLEVTSLINTSRSFRIRTFENNVRSLDSEMFSKGIVVSERYVIEQNIEAVSIIYNDPPFEEIHLNSLGGIDFVNVAPLEVSGIIELSDDGGIGNNFVKIKQYNEDMCGLATSLKGYNGKQVNCAYMFSNKPLERKDLLDSQILCAAGVAEADFYHHYSEMTGYLWTDEEGKIGGHDLLEIFRQHIGDYCYLIVSVYPIELDAE